MESPLLHADAFTCIAAHLADRQAWAALVETNKELRDIALRVLADLVRAAQNSTAPPGAVPALPPAPLLFELAFGHAVAQPRDLYVLPAPAPAPQPSASCQRFTGYSSHTLVAHVTGGFLRLTRTRLSWTSNEIACGARTSPRIAAGPVCLENTDVLLEDISPCGGFAISRDVEAGLIFVYRVRAGAEGVQLRLHWLLETTPEDRCACVFQPRFATTREAAVVLYQERARHPLKRGIWAARCACKTTALVPGTRDDPVSQVDAGPRPSDFAVAVPGGRLRVGWADGACVDAPWGGGADGIRGIVSQLRLNSTGTRAFLITALGTLTVVNVTRQPPGFHQAPPIRPGIAVNAAAFSPDGKMLAIALRSRQFSSAILPTSAGAGCVEVWALEPTRLLCFINTLAPRWPTAALAGRDPPQWTRCLRALADFLDRPRVFRRGRRIRPLTPELRGRVDEARASCAAALALDPPTPLRELPPSVLWALRQQRLAQVVGESVSSLQFSPDGQYLAVCAGETWLRRFFVGAVTARPM